MLVATPCPQSLLLAHANAHPICLDEQSDETLIELTLAGVNKAFDLIVLRYQSSFHRQAMRLVRDHDEAQDIVQTAFFNMYNKLHTFQIGSNFRSWAYRVVMNTGLMRLRKKRHRQEVALERVSPHELSPLHDDSQTYGPDQLLERQQLRQQLQRAAEQLPDKYKEVFLMREADDLSLKEIGDELGLSIPAVKSRLHRARQFMRVSLEAQPLAA